ncbi:hypothetical protein GO988_21530 [Hymenobacter sp. HMF4947]|uniref:Uncharacterized protein n=1 Tax=Hymenobacter ginkgonis TaxID=2682976 RepID=A0A7K1TKI0_9BACT|nr:hypothetical protein [Hymenobacter ginkgonis]MVN78919.1 hypothetical protein [Hymenobacter ginkgonis]
MVRGYQRRAAAKQERQLEKWRQTRLVATILRNAHRGPNDVALTPEEFLALPGDRPPLPPMDEETFDATMARLAEFDTLS